LEKTTAWRIVDGTLTINAQNAYVAEQVQREIRELSILVSRLRGEPLAFTVQAGSNPTGTAQEGGPTPTPPPPNPETTEGLPLQVGIVKDMFKGTIIEDKAVNAPGGEE
jgi:hypothetical protein